MTKTADNEKANLHQPVIVNFWSRQPD